MGFAKYRQSYQKPPGQKLEYQKFRVRTPVKTFRDLDVYKHTTQLAVEIFQLTVPKAHKKLEGEFEIFKNLAKHVPKLIAESHGNKFANLAGALGKLEGAAQIVSNIIAKLDFLVAYIDDQERKENLNMILKKYQTQRVKMLNLKKAWERVFGKAKREDGTTHPGLSATPPGRGI